MQFGVDEAGKGPVFGSMFAAAVWVEDPACLPGGIADSKRLTPARREELAAALRGEEGITLGVAEVTTAQIDDPTTDMNSLTVEAHARAVEEAYTALESIDAESTAVATDALDSPVEGLCDACDTDADRFARRVNEACALESVRIDARHGADDDSPLVGAASIVAKVRRDAHVEAIAAEYGAVGSGYPSDPKTRAFLESYVDEHGELPPFARESWSTCADVLAATSQTGLGEF